jgi:energy-coupling factor transport system substrate-specific component
MLDHDFLASLVRPVGRTEACPLASHHPLRRIIRKSVNVPAEVDSVRLVASRADGLQNATLVVVSIAGLLAFFLPFLISALPNAGGQVSSRTVEASLLLALIVGGSLVVTVAELVRGPGSGNQARSVAMLGALVAIDATLRLVPSFLGASPIFALIVLVGYVFGPRFGFVMGTLTLLLSAAITAGVGPWLPFQMLCTGWVGVAAGWLPRWTSARAELATAAALGALAGFAYGALMNLYSWPFAAPGVTEDVGLYWSPGLSLLESIERYAAFYVTTSLLHDATRAMATAFLIVVAGAPVLRLLRRFHARAAWSTSLRR